MTSHRIDVLQNDLNDARNGWEAAVENVRELEALNSELLEALKDASRELRKYVRADSPTLSVIGNLISKAERGE